MLDDDGVLSISQADVGALAHPPQVPAWLDHLGAYGLTLWAALTLNFLLPRLLPGDPISALLNSSSTMFVADDATRAHVAAYYGLDRPLWDQYGQYLVCR